MGGDGAKLVLFKRIKPTEKWQRALVACAVELLGVADLEDPSVADVVNRTAEALGVDPAALLCEVQKLQRGLPLTDDPVVDEAFADKPSDTPHSRPRVRSTLRRAPVPQS
ncbi:MAG TPA: hypothetical protein VMR98_04955 [Candidatus Polarisedimenticolaceae bacterium]|nr:hypothetical protein [Candidatus Polarisedimenticolaceae bacterium]